MHHSLIDPNQMPPLAGLSIPAEFYCVTRQPAPLGGMPYPDSSTPWDAIYAQGFRHVICLTESTPGYDSAPLQLLYAAGLEDLYHGGNPHSPERETRLIREAASAALDRLRAGEGVVVHCAGGTGRTGTVIGCILRELGFASGQVLSYLNKLHIARGRHGWPESPWQAECMQAFTVRGGREG